MRRGKRRPWRCALGWALALALTVLVALALRRWALLPVRVVGASMEPTLLSGECVLATRFDYLREAPERGDVVLCALPGREGQYIKRVIGLPGETVRIVSGQTYIDGQPLAEAYATPADADFEAALGADEYLVLGDNRPASYDSREEDIGSLASSDFLGRVRCVVWPPDRFGSDGLRKRGESYGG